MAKLLLINNNSNLPSDLGLVKPPKQCFPFFFKEDNGKFQYEIKTEDQI